MTHDDPSFDTIFSGAIEIASGEERAAFVAHACGADQELRRRVERLVEAHFQAGSFLESPPASPMSSMAWSSPPELSGTVIGPYKLLQVIGEGGMGTVYMAEQTQPVRRTVALKLIKAGMDSRQVLARFGAERQALALMDHPNIAKVHDAGTTDTGRPYFVMELVKGIPITRFCDERRLTTRERLELAIPVCQAVQHAHQKGIIHRDIKPSNVLIALYDGKPVPKVIDFGVAKATGPRLTDQTLYTEFGAVVGTLEYMSPEQAELNQLDIDTRSDIYSLGVLLYELLTGSTPLDRKRLKQGAILEVLRLICEEESPRPSLRLSTTDELPSIAACRNTEPRKLSGLMRGELDWIVMKALEKDRTRRYETANGLAADLRRYLDDEPVQACPPSARYRLRKFAGKHRVVLVGGGLVTMALLAALGSVAGSVGWAVRDRQSRQAALDREVKRALEDVGSWRRQDDLPEAQAALKRAEGLLAGGGGSESARRQVQSWRTDLGRATRLEEILFTREEDENRLARSMDAAYTRVFAELGIDMDRTDAGAAARVIGSQRIRDSLLNALDDWSDKRHDLSLFDPGVGKRWWQRPMVLARAIDPDAFSNRVRLAVIQEDWAALDRLVRDPGASSLSLTQLLLLTKVVFRGQVPNGRARSVAVLKAALTREPGNFKLNSALSDCYSPRGLGQTEEFLRYAQTALALRPNSALAHHELGVALSVRGRPEEAIAWYRKAIELAPKYAKAHSNLGLALSSQGKQDEAAASCRKAIELDPKYANAHSSLGVVLFRQEKWHEAAASCRKAIELDPKDADAHTNLGNALAGQGKLDEAIACLRTAIELDPKYAKAHSNLGCVFSRQGKPDEAVACCRKALDLDPKLADAHTNLGAALGAQGKLDEAIACFRRALELNPKDTNARLNLGAALGGQGKLDEAIDSYRKAIELDPKSAAAQDELGLALGGQGKLDEAIAALRKAVELERQSARYQENLGGALRTSGRTDDAIVSFREAIRLGPTTPSLYQQLAGLLLERREAALARGVFEDGLRQHADSAALLNDLAWLLAATPEAEVRDARRAVELARKAVGLAPQVGGFRNTLGVALYRAGDWKEAVESLTKSMELVHGGDGNDWLFLAMAHWQLGDKKQARSWYDKAVPWMEKNQPKNEDLIRFRAEAAALLEVKAK